MRYKNILILLLFVWNSSRLFACQEDSLRTLIVFFDGLRPDYITKDLMPNLFAFSQTGSQGLNHKSVFPTVTRVNATSYSTGSYPSMHGILGNSIFFPASNSKKVFNTGEIRDLLQADSLLNGKLVSAVTLGDVLMREGKQMVVFSSGSTGQAYLQNSSKGAIIFNTELPQPDSVINTIGAIPPSAKPNSKRHQWITDALIKYGISKSGPLVSAIWYSDPDGAAHSDGIGSPAAVESIKSVDREFGRIISALNSSGEYSHYNIIISTDHGFVTYIGKESLTKFLINKGFKQSINSEDIIVAGGAIYISNGDTSLKRKIVHSLQETSQFGAIFMKPSSLNPMLGELPGTISYDAINWNFIERVPDILVDMNWNDSINEYGYRGSSFSSGVAGHGSLSPYETNIRMIVSGPSFKKGGTTSFPTANVDIVPTILKLHGIQQPSTMQGRPVEELFENVKSVKSKKAVNKIIEASTKVGSKNYRLRLHQIIYKGYTYIDYAETFRQ